MPNPAVAQRISLSGRAELILSGLRDGTEVCIAAGEYPTGGEPDIL